MSSEAYVSTRVAALMSDGQPRTYSDIEKALGVAGGAISAIRGAIWRMKKHGQVHIVGWVPSTIGTPSAIYQFGPGEDARYVRTISTAEQKRIWRAGVLAREQERLNYGGQPIVRDPFVAVLFGQREPMRPSALPSHVYVQPMGDDMEAA